MQHTPHMRSIGLYHRHRFPAEIISHCVWLYFRFPLSFRDVEERLAMRGVVLSYETIREWCLKFGQTYAVFPQAIKGTAVCSESNRHRQVEELWCGEGRSNPQCRTPPTEISEQPRREFA